MKNLAVATEYIKAKDLMNTYVRAGLTIPKSLREHFNDLDRRLEDRTTKYDGN